MDVFGLKAEFDPRRAGAGVTLHVDKRLLSHAQRGGLDFGGEWDGRALCLKAQLAPRRAGGGLTLHVDKRFLSHAQQGVFDFGGEWDRRSFYSELDARSRFAFARLPRTQSGQSQRQSATVEQRGPPPTPDTP